MLRGGPYVIAGGPGSDVRGLMMEAPLLLKRIAWRAENLFGDKEVVTRVGEGTHRYKYAEAFSRSRQLATALTALGVAPGDRVGTLAWNDYRHLEAYFAVPCMGAVLHTINLRLHRDQLAYVINHAADKVLLVAPDLLPLLEGI